MENKKYYIPSLWRIILGRFIDLVLILLFSFSFRLIIKNFIINNDQNIIFIIQNLIFSIIFLIIIPIIFKGKTLGKFLMNLNLITNNRLSLKIICRELIFIFIPQFLNISILFIFFIFKLDREISVKINGLFLFFWFIFILIDIYFQKEHISFIDLTLNIKVLNSKKIKENHVKLNNTIDSKKEPGVLDNVLLEEVVKDKVKKNSIFMNKKDIISINKSKKIKDK